VREKPHSQVREMSYTVTEEPWNNDRLKEALEKIAETLDQSARLHKQCDEYKDSINEWKDYAHTLEDQLERNEKVCKEKDAMIARKMELNRKLLEREKEFRRQLAKIPVPKEDGGIASRTRSKSHQAENARQATIARNWAHSS